VLDDIHQVITDEHDDVDIIVIYHEHIIGMHHDEVDDESLEQVEYVVVDADDIVGQIDEMLQHTEVDEVELDVQVVHRTRIIDEVVVNEYS
jgi:hypothetical protein